jgi:MerR family transcriptional regulator, heat shock protein HspR
MSSKYLPLSEAAARLGCSPDFIERLEHEGLIDVKRTLDDVPVISADGLERVRFIALLTEELEVNLPGAEVILHMRDDMIAMQRQFEEILESLVAEVKRGLASGPRRPRGEE